MAGRTTNPKYWYQNALIVFHLLNHQVSLRYPVSETDPAFNRKLRYFWKSTKPIIGLTKKETTTKALPLNMACGGRRPWKNAAI